MRKIYVLMLLAISLSGKLLAQQELNAFTVTGSGQATTFSTDYECIGINPSNLGWDSKRRLHLGFLETGASIYSDALAKDQIRNDFLNFNHFGGNNLSFGEKKDAAQQFASKGISINIDEQWLGAAYQRAPFGGIGFSIRERVTADIKLNDMFADLLFNGRNSKYFDIKTINALGDSVGQSSNPSLLGALTNRSFVRMSWYREYNLAYGRKVWSNDLIKLYGGVTLKYLQGYGIIDVESNNNQLTAYSSLSPIFKVNYGRAGASADTSGSFSPVGQGFGFDIGGSAEIGKNIIVGLSFNNIGAMTWKGNVYEVTDQPLVSLATGGFNNLNLLSEQGAFTSDTGVFRWKGVKSRTTSLPADMRLGAQYKFFNWLKAGIDVFVPISKVPGNLRNPVYSLGGEVNIVNILHISTGMTFGTNYKFNIPVGFVITTREYYQFGIASRDIISYFTNHDPNLSMVFGFLRFGI